MIFCTESKYQGDQQRVSGVGALSKFIKPTVTNRDPRAKDLEQKKRTTNESIKHDTKLISKDVDKTVLANEREAR